MSSTLSTVPLIAAVVIAAVVWLVAAWSFFCMLRHVRNGPWYSLAMRWGWYSPSRVHEHIEPAGLPHYRRFMKAFVAFFAVFVFIMVYSVFLALSRHP